SGDSTIFVFNQMYEGIPVYGRTVSITLDSDNYTKALNSGFLSGIDVSTEAKITKDEAKAIVQKNYEGYKIQSGSLKQVIYSIDTEPF
ncbi:MAG: hypothetical protein Q4G23_01335, partial [Clostridia bacterium]|nr:hypothetical protein [Clostridia bacterium]